MTDFVRLDPAAFLARLPLPASDRWPEGVFDVEAFEHAGLTLELFAPRGIDRQSSHGQDELYFVVSGSARLEIDGVAQSCASGDALFVPARVQHHFVDISDDFVTWAVFWGVAKP